MTTSKVNDIVLIQVKQRLARERLNAAAPELLAALKDSSQYLGKLAADHDGTFCGRSAAWRLRKNDALIAKAEGGPDDAQD